MLLQFKSISNLKNSNPNLLTGIQRNIPIDSLNNYYNHNPKENLMYNMKNNDYNNYNLNNYNNIYYTNINKYQNIINNKNNVSFPLSQNSVNDINNSVHIQNNNLYNINIIQQLALNNNENNVNNIKIYKEIQNICKLNNINDIANNNYIPNLNQILNYYNSLNQNNITSCIQNNIVENNINYNFMINNCIKKNNLNANNIFDSLLINEKLSINNNYPKKYLEDFIKYLKNLSVPLVDFLCTPKGTLEIQKKIGKIEECKILLIKILNKEGLSTIMKNTYGNYFFQHIIKGTEDIIISLIISFISDNFVEISKDSNGTFSVQALLSEISSITEEQQILNSIKDYEMLMAYDKNATYVLQKIILLLPDSHRIDLNEKILNNFKELCLDSNGICLIKNFIKTNTLQSNKQRIIKEIVNNFIILAENPYGNYGIQYLMENWNINDLNDIKNKIMENIYKLSIQQFSSNVVEKAFEVFDEHIKERMIKKIIFESNFIVILKNKFGRFVLNKAINYMKDDSKKMFEIFLLNNINNNIYSNKDKNKVRSFLMKINDKTVLNKEYVRNNMGNNCIYNINNSIINNNFRSNSFFS